MIEKPAQWAKCDPSRFHSKSSAYAAGFERGWRAALEQTAGEIDRAIAATLHTNEDKT